MRFKLMLGVPEFKALYDCLVQGAKELSLGKDDMLLFKQLTMAMVLLSSNPRHNSLNSHEIEAFSVRYTKTLCRQIKVWQSYLENNIPAAGRIFWVYGPGRGEITIIGLEPHPEDRKKAGYLKVNLSDLPD